MDRRAFGTGETLEFVRTECDHVLTLRGYRDALFF